MFCDKNKYVRQWRRARGIGGEIDPFQDNI